MNRTDRLHAIVEDLRSVAPRTRSARSLAEHHEVSVRTIERDLHSLQRSGVPIRVAPGRAGGYRLGGAMSFPPLDFSPAEAVAVAVALHGAVHTPLHRAAESALGKILAAMPARDAAAAAELADLAESRSGAGAGTADPAVRPPSSVPVPTAVEEALITRRVLRLRYRDEDNTISEREVEPTAFVSGRHGWYVAGWCRLRDGMRLFRLDRIVAAHDIGEHAPPRAMPWIEPFQRRSGRTA
ncbi:helix-turn-helix transcriptional regulator [Pseudonocardia sp. GCM10023141]|uniref:helix-turn-helix transcriptional regulator n=1 Tax=Pseudonocardia sp. GCM10023141 TaxID=3252653 RepID=UPI003606337A